MMRGLEHLLSADKHLKGRCPENGAGLFSVVCSDRMRSITGMDITEIQEVSLQHEEEILYVEGGSTAPVEVEESPSVREFKAT